MNNEFAQYITDLLAPHGSILVKRMFGGHGVYCDGLFIAILHAESLFLKADENSRPAFEHAGCAVFTYKRGEKTASLGFYEAPADAMESPALIGPWARLAIQAALRSQSGKTRNRPTARPVGAQAKAGTQVTKRKRRG